MIVCGFQSRQPQSPQRDSPAAPRGGERGGEMLGPGRCVRTGKWGRLGARGCRVQRAGPCSSLTSPSGHRLRDDVGPLSP